MSGIVSIYQLLDPSGESSASIQQREQQKQRPQQGYLQEQQLPYQANQQRQASGFVESNLAPTHAQQLHYQQQRPTAFDDKYYGPPMPPTAAGLQSSTDLSKYHLGSDGIYHNGGADSWTGKAHNQQLPPPPQIPQQPQQQIQADHYSNPPNNHGVNYPEAQYPSFTISASRIPLPTTNNSVPTAVQSSNPSDIDFDASTDKPRVPHKARKRKRVPVSCNTCRHRKIKCDRQRPCSSCLGLNLGNSCKYESLDSASQEPLENWKVSNEGQLERCLFKQWNAKINSQSVLIYSPLGSRSYSSSWRRLTDHNRYKLMPKLLNLLTDPEEREEVKAAQSKLTCLFNINLEGTFSHKAITSPNNNVVSVKKPKTTKGYDSNKNATLHHDVTENGASLGFLAETLSSEDENEEKAKTLLNLIKDSLAPLSSSHNSDSTATAEVSASNSDTATRASASPDEKLFVQSVSSVYYIKDLRKWWVVVSWLPPREVCELLIERYLKTANVWFHSLTKDIADEILDHVFVLKKLYQEGRTHEHELTKDDMHKIGILFAVICISVHVTPLDWLDTLNDTEWDHHFYLGRNIGCLVMAIVNITDATKESSMWYCHLILLLAIYSVVVTGELDINRESSWTALFTFFFRSCSNVGMHRDPKSLGLDLPEHHVYMRKVLWRIAVYFDTVTALELLKPTFFCLKYAEDELLTDAPSEASLSRLTPEMRNVAMTVHKNQQKLMEWCQLARDLLHNVILVPDTKQEITVVEKYQKVVDDFYNANVTKRDEKDISNNTDSSLLQFDQEAKYTLEYMLHHRITSLKLMILSFAQKVLESRDPNMSEEKQLIAEIFPDSQSVKISIQAMKFEYFYMRQTNRTTFLKYYMTSVAARTGLPFWLIAVGYLAMRAFLPKVSGRLYDHVHLACGDILQAVFRGYRSVCAIGKYKYYPWKVHLLLHAVLNNFHALTYENGGHVPHWQSMWDEYMTSGNELVSPRDRSWSEKVMQDFGMTD